MSPPQKIPRGVCIQFSTGGEESLGPVLFLCQLSPYPLESTHLLQDVHDYGTEAIGI